MQNTPAFCIVSKLNKSTSCFLYYEGDRLLFYFTYKIMVCHANKCGGIFFPSTFQIKCDNVKIKAEMLRGKKSPRSISGRKNENIRIKRLIKVYVNKVLECVLKWDSQTEPRMVQRSLIDTMSCDQVTLTIRIYFNKKKLFFYINTVGS